MRVRPWLTCKIHGPFERSSAKVAFRNSSARFVYDALQPGELAVAQQAARRGARSFRSGIDARGADARRLRARGAARPRRHGLRVDGAAERWPLRGRCRDQAAQSRGCGAGGRGALPARGYSVNYRAGKFVRRHRGSVAVAVFALAGRVAAATRERQLRACRVGGEEGRRRGGISRKHLWSGGSVRRDGSGEEGRDGARAARSRRACQARYHRCRIEASGDPWAHRIGTRASGDAASERGAPLDAIGGGDEPRAAGAQPLAHWESEVVLAECFLSLGQLDSAEGPLREGRTVLMKFGTSHPRLLKEANVAHERLSAMRKRRQS